MISQRVRKWVLRGRGEGCIKLQGRLLPVKDKVEAGSDSDEDEDSWDRSDPEFLDAEEIEAGALQIPSVSPKNSKVKILTKDSKEYKVYGFFPLTDPWWSVTVYAKQADSLYFVRGFPSYKLEDDILGNESVLSIFLNTCNVQDGYRQDFLAWVKDGPPVTFSRLVNLAKQYDETRKTNLSCYLINSGCGNLAFKALDIPCVLRYLPKLLPHKIRSLLMLHDIIPLSTIDDPDDLPSLNETSDDKTSKIYKLEEMLDTDPWKLGFGSLLYKELNLSGCEARLAGFQQCDENLLGKIPDLQLNALHIYSELKKQCMEFGDTYVEEPTLTKKVSKEMSVVDAWEALEFLKEQKIVMIEQGRVFLYNYYRYEKSTAAFIETLVMRKLQNPEVEVNDVLGSDHTSQKEENLCSSLASQTLIQEFSDEQIQQLQINDCMTEENHTTMLDAEQRRAARMILANPVTIISGKGGCGKTTVVSLVFKAVMQKERLEVEEACKALEDDMDASDEWDFNATDTRSERRNTISILLTAPTGKAASLLKKKTKLPAATLHQITCSYSAWKKRKDESEANSTSRWKFSAVEALVVDEGSLVSVRILSTVLKLLCTHARLAKLVILGDVRQLPSIEPGNLLADIFATFATIKGMNWAIELKTNHRAESQLIVDNATRISIQQSLNFDAVVHIDGNKKYEMPGEEKKCILVSLADENDLSTAIIALLNSGPGLQDDKNSQFIAFRRKDCLLINELCCIRYSQHSMKNAKKKYDFRCNDKVCCTKNAYVKDLQTKSRSQEGEQNNTDSMTQSKDDDDQRICNGEIFYITHDVLRDEIRELTISDGDEREYTLNYKKLRRLGGLSYAWARTIHTFQGSEEDTVVYVLNTAGRQNWKHVYTAVTRGRKRVYIIANSAQLDRAIANKCRERKTRLQQRLKDRLSQTGAFPQSSPPSTNLVCTQLTQERPSMASQEHLHTPHKSPPFFRCSSVPTTPDVASSKKGYDDEDYSAAHVMPSLLGSPVNGESRLLDESPSQKRAGIPMHDRETPSKIHRPDNPMNLVEMSPASRLQTLNIHSSCTKKLFNR